MSKRLEGKIAVITGGGSGIGEAISRRFASEGAEVIILDVNEEPAKKVADSINGKCFQCDISDSNSVETVFKTIAEEGSHPDILVNNAGIAHIGNATDTDPDDFDRIMSVNVRGPYLCIRAIIPSMIKKGGGSILNLASVASNLGIPDRFAYSTSKGAVYTMTLSVARDFVEKGIRCNCLCPARVHTPFVDNYLKENYPGKEKEMFTQLEATQPIGRMAKPSEIAALATYICSDEASFVTGSAFDIDGGFTLLK
ncbi:MAG: SDR family oxidoreductase [Verrucomicrobiales bacterium]|jgi:NAD(P)-dependent dehydrogenase (short-subunit alcohol dehydrogenase family)|nr:SDR family oxidoreductase [Verrucomicrobiales bacterium]MEC7358226.1 SDR family oxidoreductase [Verrucomicrobiota bacterium]